MSTLSTVISVVAMLILGSRYAAAQLTSCYQCTYTYSTSIVASTGNINCVQVGASTSTSSGTTGSACQYCTTTISGGETPNSGITIQRSCMQVPGFVGPMCFGGTCMCNTTNCNNQPIDVGSLSCYSCNSMPGINTGCEDPFMATSIYLQTIQGCTACIKTVQPAAAGGGVTYMRGCLYGNATSSVCSGGACNSICTTDKCNSASSLTSSFLMAAVLLVLGVCSKVY